MAIAKVGGAIAPSGSASVGPAEKFKDLMGGAKPLEAGVAPAVSSLPARVDQIAVAKVAKSPAAAQPRSVQRTAAGRNVEPAKLLSSVVEAQKRMEHVLRLAQSGKSFSPAELLALQANVYSASQELDLAGKVVDKATSGLKQVLQTQL